MSLDDARACRRRAEEAAAISEKMIDPLDRAAWQKVAIEWLRLAETAYARKKKTAPAQAQR